MFHLETKIDRKLYMLKVNSVSVSKVCTLNARNET